MQENDPLTENSPKQLAPYTLVGPLKIKGNGSVLVWKPEKNLSGERRGTSMWQQRHTRAHRR